MRLTTKIFIGFLIGILSIILIFIFYLKTREVDSYPISSKEHEFEEATEAISVPPYKVVSISKGVANLSLEGAILSQKENPGKVVLNKDLVQYTNMDVRNDTLFISINDDKILEVLELESKKNTKLRYYGYPKAYGAKIYLPEQRNMHIVSKLSFDIYLDNLNIDLLELTASGSNNITLNTSKLKTFTFGYEHPNTDMTFKFLNSHLGIWNIDAKIVDASYSDLSSSLIEVVNVSGDEACELPYIKYNTLNWLPSNEAASLSLKLKQATTVEMKK